ncbi:MAG TPA: hypothetical protein VJX67_13705 [Blastocatellia bacterium]|nr:hypothetical protein [Blastocatellia bacterium]
MSKSDDVCLLAKAEAIESKEDFAQFANLLAKNYREHPEEWGNQELECFLDALGELAGSIDGHNTLLGRPKPNLGSVAWRVFADILLAARVYE